MKLDAPSWLPPRISEDIDSSEIAPESEAAWMLFCIFGMTSAQIGEACLQTKMLQKAGLHV